MFPLVNSNLYCGGNLSFHVFAGIFYHQSSAADREFTLTEAFESMLSVTSRNHSPFIIDTVLVKRYFAIHPFPLCCRKTHYHSYHTGRTDSIFQ